MSRGTRSGKDHSVLLSVLLGLLTAALLFCVAFGVYRLLCAVNGVDPRPIKTTGVQTAPAASAQPVQTPAAGTQAVHEHLWQEATCTEPRTCQLCGETEGEPAGHQPTEADYWTGSVCSVCGETLSPPLQSEFELHGLVINMEVGQSYDYVTRCGENAELATVGQASVTRYEVFPSGEGVESIPGKTWDLPARDGYEWRLVTRRIVFSDDAAQNYGMNVKESFEDYYRIPLHTETGMNSAEHNNGVAMYFSNVVWKEDEQWFESSFPLTYRGAEYDCLRIYDGGFSGWGADGTNVFTITTAVQVPVGYDGCVLVLFNSVYGDPGPDWDYVYNVADEDTLFFRLY